jgi:type II secretory ATPase GspE/PulE/Tfp pilus assembly ATPase PilB-like protein
MEILLALGTIEGFYINPWKLIPAVVLLLILARVMTWADKDSDVAHLPRVPVNLGMMGLAILGFALFFFIPNFLIASLALFFIVALAGGGYVGLRASQVGTKDLKKQFSDWLGGFRKEAVVAEVESQLQLLDAKGKFIEAPEADHADRPGFDAVQSALVDPLRKNAERVQLVPSGEGAKVVYVVDGYTYSGSTPDRTAAAAAVDYIKKAARLDITEKRKPQKGKLKGSVDGKKREMDITTSGSSAGESLDVLIDAKSRHAQRLSDLGLSDIQMAAIKDSMEIKQGIILLAAPKGAGLTSLCYAVIRAHDAFLTHIQTIERNADQELEGITQNKLSPGAAPSEELKQVSWVVSQEPDLIMMTSLEEPGSARELIKHAGEGRKAYVAVRAESAMDAVNVWRKWVGDDSKALKYLIMAISGRVVRKLCVQCKVAITPDPEQLRKMNLDPNKVSQLYQERVEPMLDPKGNPIFCDICQELRFKGRAGVYEVVILDDEVRQALLTGAGGSQLRGLIRKQRMPSLQESALDLIQKGETSIKEVQRIFAPPASKSGSSAPKASV